MTISLAYSLSRQPVAMGVAGKPDAHCARMSALPACQPLRPVPA